MNVSMASWRESRRRERSLVETFAALLAWVADCRSRSWRGWNRPVFAVAMTAALAVPLLVPAAQQGTALR